jgi:transcriptional regulator with AAA-type ATPase domain
VEDRLADCVDLLLPEGSLALREHARRAVTLLRLVTDDARGASTEVVAGGLERARQELARVLREEAVDALEDLLPRYVSAALDADTFLALPEPRRSLHESWFALDALRASIEGLPELPGPRETPLQAARRLTDALALQTGDGPSVRAWRARLERAGHGAARAEQAWRVEASRLEREGAPAGPRAKALAGLAAALLDQGALRRARELLEPQLDLAACDEDVAWLLTWTHLLQGETAIAFELAAALPPRRGSLPLALCELRTSIAEWTRALSGRVPEGSPAGPVPASSSGADRITSRRELGASCLAVIELGAARSTRLVHVDAAPALTERVEPWRRAREGALSQVGEPEQRLLVAARGVVQHRMGSSPLRGALAPQAARALALTPILDVDGEVIGWLHVECEHHLLPSSARLLALAADWRDALGTGGASARSPGSLEKEEVEHDSVLGPDDARASAAQGLWESLGCKSAMRRWWVFACEGDAPLELAAEGGEAFADWREQRGGARCLRRALVSAAPILLEETEPALVLAASAASALIVPIALRGRILGLLAIESTRRRDFREIDAARLSTQLARAATAWRAAQFAAWHAQRFMQVLAFEGLAGERLDELCAAGRARSGMLLVGPPGTGKETHARWLHFEGSRRAGHCVTTSVVGGACEDLERRLFGSNGRAGAYAQARGGTLILRGVERLPAALQERLLERMEERRDEDPRLLGTAWTVPDPKLGSGVAGAPLVEHLARLVLHVPPLVERRNEIPALVRTFAARAASAEGLAPPVFDDEAIALLWRQSWPDNVRGLEVFVWRAVVLADHPVLGFDDIRRAARSVRQELVEKLPSRHPDSRTLEAALRLTRKASGSWNKTRAASYLGWDPDTLLARLKELHMEEPSELPSGVGDEGDGPTT